jgi:5-methylcytosine-specific restriction protein B
LFDPYQDNRGWRLLILSVPPVSAGAVGLASHYQNAQNHDHLAKVSELLFDHVAAAAQQAHLQLPGRKVSKSDWTSDSLFPRPIVDVDGADLSGVPGDGRLLMRDVRTTTVKKVLASMISVQPFDLEDTTGAALAQVLPQLEAIGRLIA